MLIIDTVKDLLNTISLLREKGKTIGFVPTMGALHQGHISLITISKLKTDVTICSIFVNPTQFNNPSDLKHYPRTPELDIKLLEGAQCDIVYMPHVKDVYPKDDTRKFDFGYLDTILEGAHRPGHFNGVGQVVSILLRDIMPNKAFFGSKDYQQVMVIKELVRQLNYRVEIIACPILREEDGLAMSSRNMLLSKEERTIAALVPKMMQEARVIAEEQGINAAKFYINKNVSEVPVMKLDYYEICDAETLKPIDAIAPNQQAISLIAVFVGKIRLIDNWMIS